MAGSINKVILIGNLGKDPEVRNSSDGTKIVNLVIATNESWKDKNSGDRREKTEWHRAVIFNDKLADIAEKYLKKGARLYIEGQLQTRKWNDQNGQERYTTEIVLNKYRGELTLLDGRQNANSDFGQDNDFGSSNTSGSAPDNSIDFDDDIPF